MASHSWEYILRIRAISARSILVLSCIPLAVVLACTSGAPDEIRLDGEQLGSTELSEPTATQRVEIKATTEPSPTAEPTVIASPTPVPTSKPIVVDLTPKQIYDLVSNSIGFISTPTSTGTGFLIDGNFIVTNMHIVWPYSEVDIIFPDGSIHQSVPLAQINRHSDLAILGPISTDLEPLNWSSEAGSSVGSDVYLVGYPGDTSGNPQPALIEALVSRFHISPEAEVSFIQLDASVAGGQSGSPLLNKVGEVIGVIGLSFTEANYGLAAAASEVRALISSMVATATDDPFGDRNILNPVSLDIGTTLHSKLDDEWGEIVYILDHPANTEIDLNFTSESDLLITAVDAYGSSVAEVDNTLAGTEYVRIDPGYESPIIVTPLLVETGAASIIMTSSHPIGLWVDPDERQFLNIGTTYVGGSDYFGDFDAFEIELEAGDVITANLFSVTIDGFIQIGQPGISSDNWAWDDDSGGGMFGLDPELVFRAEESGIYLIVVSDAFLSAVGGYTLTVQEATARQVALLPEPVIKIPTPTPAPRSAPTGGNTEIGKVKAYVSKQYPFGFIYPATWVHLKGIEELGHTDGFWLETTPSGLQMVSVTEIDLIANGHGRTSLDEYMDLQVAELYALNLQDFELLSISKITTEQGVTVGVIEYTATAAFPLRAKLMSYVHNEAIAIQIGFIADSDAFTYEVSNFADYAFRNFVIISESP